MQDSFAIENKQEVLYISTSQLKYYRMKTLEEKIEAYNKYAMKHDYDTICVVDGKLLGEFQPKDENLHSGFIGFFKNMVTVYHNGYLKGDYDDIVASLASEH